MMKMKKITVLLVVLMALFLQACGSSSSGVVQTIAPTISYKFSSDYNTSTVTITNNLSGATVRYTTDGSEPTTDSKEYIGTFDITDSGNLIKTKAFKDGLSNSDTISASIPVGKKALTIMYYGDGDNNLETYLLEDIEEMKNGFNSSGDYNLITLFDRIPSYSSNSATFGENFDDSRLYKIGKGITTRLGGWTEFPEIKRDYSYEANMGDANTLKKFIQYCKANYPADKYVLIISNHGGGAKTLKSTSSSITKDICQDVTNGGDIMYTGEMLDILTLDESINVMVLDACLMGSVEFAYQFRKDNGGFNSEYMVASPALVDAKGLPYDTILSSIVDTYNMSILSKLIVSKQYDKMKNDSSQTFSAYDLSKMTGLKTSIDTFSKAIVGASEKIDFESIRGTDSSNTAMNYFDSSDEEEWIEYPFFDIYDLMKKVNNSSKFSDEFKGYANNVQIALGNVILSSFGGSEFTGFTNNKNGMHIIFPKEAVSLYDSVSQADKNYWSLSVLYWYTPTNLNTLTNGAKLYGNLSFCSGGSENGIVENWFEMIDYWYDNNTSSVNSGKGYNYCKY